MEKTDNPFWLYIAPAIFTLLWAAGYGVSKLGLQFAEPMTLLSLRYAFAVLLLLPFFLIMRPKLPSRRKDWLHIVVVGILVQAVYFGGCWWAFSVGVSAGVLAIFMSLQPILVAVLAPSITNERVGWHRWMGLFAGLLGVLVVIVARSDLEPPTVVGIGLSALALFAMTAGVLYEKRFGVSHHPVVTNIVQYVVGFVLVLPVALSFETMAVNWTVELVAALGYLVIGNSIIAISLLLAMIRVGEVARVSSLLFLVPPLAALFGWILLGEEMPPVAWAGMALAAIGVTIATRKRNEV